MSILQNPTTLLCSGGVLAGFSALFFLYRRSVGGTYLDFIFSHQKAQNLVNNLSPAQANRHLVATCCLDSVIPVCLGIVLAGLTLLVASLDKVWLILPALSAALFDYCENVTHIIALKRGQVPRLKPLFTSLKFILYSIAVALLGGLFVWSL